MKCHSNSVILHQLSSLRCPEDLTEIDLRRNFAGPVGCLAILSVAQHAPNLHTLNLEGNQLTNSFADTLAEALVRQKCEHASWRFLTSIVLTGNGITSVGAKKLLAAVLTIKKDPELAAISPPHSIVIHLANNYVNPMIVSRLGNLGPSCHFTAASSTNDGNEGVAPVVLAAPSPGISGSSVSSSTDGSPLLPGQGAEIIFKVLLEDLPEEVCRGELSALATLFAEWDLLTRCHSARKNKMRSESLSSDNDA